MPAKLFLICLGINFEFLMLFLTGGTGRWSPPEKIFEPFRYQFRISYAFSKGGCRGSEPPVKIFEPFLY